MNDQDGSSQKNMFYNKKKSIIVQQKESYQSIVDRIESEILYVDGNHRTSLNKFLLFVKLMSSRSFFLVYSS